MNSPLVTIIIPVYNVCPYLSEALDSVIEQTYKNLEIIIVDDGSSDGSEIICDDYKKKDSRIKVIHQENKGLSSARNAALDIATGDMISFADPDDVFSPDMIGTLLEVMEKNNAEISICGFSWERSSKKRIAKDVFQGESNRPIYHTEVLDKFSALRLIESGSINTAVWDKLYVRNIWENLRFPDGHVYEGTYVVFDIFERVKRVAIIDEKLLIHRKRMGSICNTYSLKNALDSHFASFKYISQMKNYTPDVFSIEQLKKNQKRSVRRVITDYLYFSDLNKNDHSGRDALLKDVQKAHKKGYVRVCSIPVRIIVFEIQYIPGLAVLTYRMFRLLKRKDRKA